MEIRQIFLPQMANFCYMAGDPDTKTCAVIDPAFDPKKIMAEIRDAGYTITHVINTHGHADHTSGNAAILDATDARLCIHEADAQSVSKLLSRALNRVVGGKGSPKADCILHDKDIIEIGQSRLNVIHTPGHTPGCICLYTPGHVFTGDTLFVEAVGRTDLAGGSHEQLLASVHEKLFALPDDTRVWPGHDYGPAPWSTIAHEKQNNPFL